jgi:hypothetical protein
LVISPTLPLHLLLPGDGISDGFRQRGFTSAHITCQNHQRRTALQVVESDGRTLMVLLRPVTRASGIYQDAENLGQTRLRLVNSDKPGKSPRGTHVGKVEPAVEKIVN